MEATMGSKKQEQSLARLDSVRDGGTGLPRVPSVAPSTAGATNTEATSQGDTATDTIRATVLGDGAKVAVLRVSLAPLPKTCNTVRGFHVRCNRQQAATLRSLRDWLWDNDKKLNDGKPVNSPARAVQWMLENLEAVQ